VGLFYKAPDPTWGWHSSITYLTKTNIPMSKIPLKQYQELIYIGPPDWLSDGY